MNDATASGSSKLREIRRRRRRAAILRRLSLVVLVAAGVGGYLWYSQSDAPEALPPREDMVRGTPVAPVERPTTRALPEEGAEVEATAEPPFQLPPLDESDPLVREWTGRLSSHLELASWLVTDDLIRRFTAAVDNIAEGNRLHRHVGFLAPTAPFRAAERDGQLFTDPTSYERYDLVSDVFVSLDVTATVRTYRRLKPLIDEAYRDLGYPDRSFDDTLARAIRELLNAPVVLGEAELTPGVVGYEFWDPALEALSPAQKQLLRMGPRNVGRVQGKLRRFAAALGIPKEELPRVTVHGAEN